LTSYHWHNGRMVEEKLPPDFGEKQALKNHPDLAAWAAKSLGKWVWCARCRVNVPALRYASHVRDVHPPKK
jgi:hypothetical protein